MELNQVRYFLAVCDTLNFTRAAEQCNVSQPSLTRGIKRLEEQLGGDLFRRERARTHLTELGQILRPTLNRYYQGARHAFQLAQDFSQRECASIRIGLTCSVEVDRIVGTIQGLVATVPAAELTIVRDDHDAIFTALEYGDLDFAVATGEEPGWDRLETLHRLEEPLSAFLAVNHHHSASDAFLLSYLEQETLLSEPFACYDKDLWSSLRGARVTPKSVFTMTSRCDTMSFLRAGLGVAILPEATACPPGVISLPIPALNVTCHAAIYSVSGRQHSPAGAVFAKLVRHANTPLSLSPAMQPEIRSAACNGMEG